MKRRLLGDLWDCAKGCRPEVRKDVKVAGQTPQETDPKDAVGSQKGLTYAQIASSSSSGERSSNLK